MAIQAPAIARVQRGIPCHTVKYLSQTHFKRMAATGVPFLRLSTEISVMTMSTAGTDVSAARKIQGNYRLNLLLKLSQK
jgi:hypothetical protein